MKRSQINASIAFALHLMRQHSMHLPEFAYWTPDEWQARRDELENIRKTQLGWDVTDFGYGDFAQKGAVLFTVRNGCLSDPEAGTPYAEKLIVLQQACGQEIPFHYHSVKTEDIINRGGGILAIQLHGHTPENTLDLETRVAVRMDGLPHTFEAGSVVELPPGRSITLQPGLYHRFWAKEGCGDLIAGEISSVNDDASDNHFLSGEARFAQIQEDEPVRYPLCNEYNRLLC